MPPEARLLTRLGLVLWLAAALATVWELLALQPPDSPLHLGVLAGPIAQLRNFTFAYGVAALIIARLQPARWVAWLLALGAILQVLALSYAAARGLIAVQLLDPRLDARLTLYVRAFAHALSLIALSALCLRRQSS